MKLPVSASDANVIAFIDRWAALLEREDYEGAFALTDHMADTHWTPELVREIIKSYGDARPEQRVTLQGVPTDITQRKEVTRWPTTRHGYFGELWYDLNIDGKASDLTATFRLQRTQDHVAVCLNDIHVM